MLNIVAVYIRGITFAVVVVQSNYLIYCIFRCVTASLAFTDFVWIATFLSDKI